MVSTFIKITNEVFGEQAQSSIGCKAKLWPTVISAKTLNVTNHIPGHNFL